jgi:hypothetical protein
VEVVISAATMAAATSAVMTAAAISVGAVISAVEETLVAAAISVGEAISAAVAIFDKRKTVMIVSVQRILPVFCLACLASTLRAEEQRAPIRDDAGLFHANAIARVEPRIDDIRRSFERNLFVQTVSSIAPHERRRFWFHNTRQVNRILDEQAQKIADQSGVDGIYVVICNAPHDVHVVVRPDDDPWFTRHDAESLRRTVARRLHDGDSDQALLALVDQVRATLQAHATRGQSNSVVSEFALAAILGGGIALWLVLSIVHFKRRAAHPVEEDATEQARRTPALLGAMFGSPSGLWIYDKLYPCPSGSSSTLCLPEASPPPEGETGEHTEDDPIAEERHEDAPIIP